MIILFEYKIIIERTLHVENMKKSYKKPLTIDEQIEYLQNKKRVIYNTTSKEDAKEKLYEHCYINTITPFKHRFARKDKNGNILRDNHGQHIYDRDIEFSEYYSAYVDERNKYPIIYANIQKFETMFNSVVAYEAIHYYSIENRSSFNGFLTSLKTNLMCMKLKNEYNQKACLKMSDEIDGLTEDMNKYDDIYIFMDRLSLSETITIFRCLDIELRSKIYKYLQSHDGVLGYLTFESFDEFLTRIVSIRNYICHFNSLEVLKMYFNIHSKTLRTDSDRKTYSKIIKKLSV